MKIIRAKRKTTFENRFHPNMGRICTPVRRIQISFLGLPFKTLHKYRNTYNGEVKDCEDCNLKSV
jgi:hypothetical protein